MNGHILGNIGVGSHLFLTAIPGHQLGDRLTGGHWRQKLGQQEIGEHPAQCLVNGLVLLELTWEVVRARDFPTKPSRFDALFLWADEAEARAWFYRQYMVRPQENGFIAGLYEVEVERCHRTFAANMNLISYIGSGDTIDVLMERASRYWQEEKQSLGAEILLEGEVSVCRNLMTLQEKDLCPVDDPIVGQTILRLGFEGGPTHIAWSLTKLNERLYLLQGNSVANDQLPMDIAGWIGLEVEGMKEVHLSRRGTAPILVSPGRPLRYSINDDNGTTFMIDQPLLPGTRYRPILVCDQAAALHWQLGHYWEGTLYGQWQTFSAQ